MNLARIVFSLLRCFLPSLYTREVVNPEGSTSRAVSPGTPGCEGCCIGPHYVHGAWGACGCACHGKGAS